MNTTPHRSLVTLDTLTPADANRAGAKAFNCARLMQAGFRVPDGVVLLATASDDEAAQVAAHPWFDRWPDETRSAVRSSGIGEDGEGESSAVPRTMTMSGGRR